MQRVGSSRSNAQWRSSWVSCSRGGVCYTSYFPMMTVFVWDGGSKLFVFSFGPSQTSLVVNKFIEKSINIYGIKLVFTRCIIIFFHSLFIWYCVNVNTFFYKLVKVREVWFELIDLVYVSIEYDIYVPEAITNPSGNLRLQGSLKGSELWKPLRHLHSYEPNVFRQTPLHGYSSWRSHSLISVHKGWAVSAPQLGSRD